jgi:adenosine deaminase CECR1
LMGAERIGHATNLALSPDAIEPELLRRGNILVEACLTSNHLLLGVPLAEHPFIKYLRSGIAVSLNSDDAGVFLTDMNEEFARAAENYPDLNWDELKKIARASLEHAFVPDATKQQIIKKWEADMRAFETPKDWPQALK